MAINSRGVAVEHPVPVAADFRARSRVLAFPMVLLAVYAAVVFTVSLRHEIWRDEAQAWLIACHYPNFGGVFSHLRSEGHPFLWYFCLWALAHVTHDPLAMQLFHAGVATVSVALIAFAAPFPRWQKVLIASSYLLAFEYALICRGYALGVMLVFACCALMPRRGQHVVWIGVLLALLANTSIYGAMLAVAFAGGLVAEHLWERLRDRATYPQYRTPRVVAMALLVAVGVAACYWQVRRYPNDQPGFPQAIKSVERKAAIVEAFHPIGMALVPVPHSLEEFHDSHRLAYGSFRTRVTFGLVCGAAAAGLLLVATRRPPVFVIGALATASMGAFSLLTLKGFIRHSGHFYVLLIALMWVWSSFRRCPWPQMFERPWQRLSWLSRPAATAALAALLAYHAAFGLYALASDVVRPFSGSRHAASVIRAEFPPEATIIGCRDVQASTVAALLDRPIYYVDSGQFGGPIDWLVRKRRSSPNDPMAAIRTLFPEGGEGALVSTRPLVGDGAVTLEPRGGEPPVPVLDEERMWVYAFRYAPANPARGAE